MSVLNPKLDNRQDRISHYAFLFFMSTVIVGLFYFIGLLFML